VILGIIFTMENTADELVLLMLLYYYPREAEKDVIVMILVVATMTHSMTMACTAIITGKAVRRYLRCIGSWPKL